MRRALERYGKNTIRIDIFGGIEIELWSGVERAGIDDYVTYDSDGDLAVVGEKEFEEKYTLDKPLSVKLQAPKERKRNHGKNDR
jgi:hypothetical protein